MEYWKSPFFYFKRHVDCNSLQYWSECDSKWMSLGNATREDMTRDAQEITIEELSEEMKSN